MLTELSLVSSTWRVKEVLGRRGPRSILAGSRVKSAARRLGPVA